MAAALLPYQQRVLDDGATAYWPLDDPAASATVRDLAGTLLGTAEGAITFGVPGPGAVATAARFDWDTFDAYVKLALTTIPRAATIEAWFRAASVRDTLIFSNRWGADVPVSIGTVNNGSVVVGVGSNGLSVGADNQLTDGRWHHVVMCIDGPNDTLSLYLDGVLTGPGVLALATDCTSTAATIAGNDDLTFNFWDGDLADIAIYARVLTQAEVTAHDALQRARPGDDWEAIATAPKDGRDVLGVRVPSGRQIVVHWSAPVPPAGAWVSEDPTRPIHPTHWRALSDPPPASLVVTDREEI